MIKNHCLIDFYCPVCYPQRKGIGFIVGAMVAYGEEVKGYCPVCDASFTWLVQEKGSSLLKTEQGNTTTVCGVGLIL